MADRLTVSTKGLWQDYLDHSESDNLRQQIVNAIGLRLATISAGIGYKTELGANVYLYRPTDFGQDELPGINYRDVSAEPVEEGPIGKFRWQLNFELDVKLAEGTTTPAEARKMIEDVYRCIGIDWTWGGLAQRTEQPRDAITVSQADKYVGAIAIAFAVIYDAPKWEI